MCGDIVETRIKEATRQGISPESPALVALTDPRVAQEVIPNAPEPTEGGGYYLIAATSGGADSIRELSTTASSIIRLAAETRIRRLAILPLGTGRGQFRSQAQAVGAQITRGVRIAPGSVTPRIIGGGNVGNE